MKKTQRILPVVHLAAVRHLVGPEPMQMDLGLTDTQAGWLLAWFFLSMALFAFPAAYMVDRWSRRKALTVMTVIWSCFTFLTCLGKNFVRVLLPRIIGDRPS